jgi:hypothetical protein
MISRHDLAFTNLRPAFKITIIFQCFARGMQIDVGSQFEVSSIIGCPLLATWSLSNTRLKTAFCTVQNASSPLPAGTSELM